MNKTTRIALAFLVCTSLGSSLASAQATRTWVSGVGDDVNPCSRTAPCKTFAGAISKTAAGGEISVLDPGGYGTVTITKSMTISGDGTLASILNSATTGIIVNDPNPLAPTVKVVIRNISINGAGTTVGLHGIRFLAGVSLLVDHVTMDNFSGDGVMMEMGNGVIKDSTISRAAGIALHAKGTSSLTSENGMFTGNGIAVQADGTSTIRLSNNSFYNNMTAFACGTGAGTLASAGNNRKANNVGGVALVCAPTLSITLQ